MVERVRPPHPGRDGKVAPSFPWCAVGRNSGTCRAWRCFYLFAKAYNAKFQNTLNLATLSAQVKKAVIFLGRLGYGALGVVFTIIGFFMIVAAVQFNPKEAKGLDTALGELLHLPFGRVLLGIVALGLIAYGVYSFVEARYRRLGRA